VENTQTWCRDYHRGFDKFDNKKTRMKKITARHALYAGLIAGTIDGLAAIIVYKADPVRLFQYIASGAFGGSAMEGGIPMALTGLLFHYFIATSWAFLLFLIYPRLIAVLKNKIVTGILYGVFVWSMMNLVVVPLSRIKMAPFVLERAVLGMTIIILAIGIPLSLLADRHFKKRKTIVVS
jgi:hypothetical protein